MLLVILAEGVTFTIPTSWIFGIIGAAIAALATAAAKRAWPYVKAHFSAVERLRRVETALDPKSPGLWLAKSIPPSPPSDYGRLIAGSKPIIVVANLKGGVGKTTTVANLIGHYAAKKKLKVLALDLDFQGSLSSMILSQSDYDNALTEQQDGNASKAAQLVEGRDAAWIRNTSLAVDLPEGGYARCIPSYYTLAITENRVMVEWLIGKRTDDVRYSLARALHDREIQGHYDVILIDAPPRLTTGCIQALCAATHVLIPTVLDELSAEAAAGFVNQLVVNKALWPQLRLLGVVANMTEKLTAEADGTRKDGALSDFEGDALRLVSDAVSVALTDADAVLRERQSAPLFPVETFIPSKAELGRAAGRGIAYRSEGGSSATGQLSRAFDRLGDEIDRRISAASSAVRSRSV